MKHALILFIAASLIISTSAAFAQQAAPDLEKSGVFDIKLGHKTSLSTHEEYGETHPLLKITPDKSEIIKLDRDAVKLIVGNPEHLSVLLDTPRVLVLVPRAPGATHFTILDREGQPVMSRHVVVAAASKQYVRVRRSCINAAEGSNCAAQSVYFCPDMCHEIGITQLGDDNGNNSSGDMPSDVPAGPTAEGDNE